MSWSHVMAGSTPPPRSEVADRALLSGGASSPEIYRMVATALRGLPTNGGTVLDVGCGSGRLWEFVSEAFSRYLGVDVVRYEGFPPEAELVQADLEALPLPLPAGCADVVAAIETIEHLENPRAFMRELARLARPGGIVIVTTPNQLSLLSKLTLVLKNRFNAFQDVQYPAHLTALLEVDLLRIAREAGLIEPRIAYSGSGRIVFTPWHYPDWLPRRWPRAMSDNVCVFARKAGDR
ncbi:MAG TPA: methyltransferase domain-containing protein [Candidatus Binataceae bacterium]|nr:methyltransferase domain-containing protein [Candidatus Binataceae bacterium]